MKAFQEAMAQDLRYVGPSAEGYAAGLRTVRDKWERIEAEEQAAFDACPKWRLYKRSLLHARLQGLNMGLLALTFRIVEADNGYVPNRERSGA